MTQAAVDLQRIIEGHEHKHSTLRNHSSNVARAVTLQLNDLSVAQQQWANSAAWAHSVALGGLPGRCSGGPKPAEKLVESLIRELRVAHVLKQLTRLRHLDQQFDPLDVDLLIAMACAVDALELPAGTNIFDIERAWGYPTELLTKTQTALKDLTSQRRQIA